MFMNYRIFIPINYHETVSHNLNLQNRFDSNKNTSMHLYSGEGRVAFESFVLGEGEGDLVFSIIRDAYFLCE